MSQNQVRVETPSSQIVAEETARFAAGQINYTEMWLAIETRLAALRDQSHG